MLRREWLYFLSIYFTQTEVLVTAKKSNSWKKKSFFFLIKKLNSICLKTACKMRKALLGPDSFWSVLELFSLGCHINAIDPSTEAQEIYTAHAQSH